MSDTFRPLLDRVLLRRTESAEEKTASGIIIPDSAKEKGQTGEVVAVGPGRLSPEGTRISMTVKPGNRVFFGKYAGTEVGENLIVVREDEILGIFE